LIGKTENLTATPPTITIDGFIRHEALERITILHADIQGHEYEMLLGTKASIRQGLIEFIFISSHGFKLYAQCLRFLRKYGYRIICEHTPAESFAVDGLIVATLDREMVTVAITKRHTGVRGCVKSFICRLISHIPIRMQILKSD